MTNTSSISVINLRTTPLNRWRRVMQTRGTPEEWPSSSSLLCWWCCHAFDTVPCYLPVHYDEANKAFAFAGNFCSWNCVKRYAFLMKSPPPAASYIGILAFSTSIRCEDDTLHTTGLCECSQKESVAITIAPDRERLEAFGGPMSIQEYRKGFLTIPNHARVRYVFETCESKRAMRNCVFTRVTYEGPSQIFTSIVQVLPYSSRSVVAPNAPKPNQTTSAPAAPRSRASATGPPIRQPRASSTRTVNRTPLQPSNPQSSVLAVNEEQAFYTRRLSTCGNLLDSMGIVIQR